MTRPLTPLPPRPPNAMSLPTRLAAYADCIDLFARAANTSGGSRALLGTRAAAYKYSMRMHMTRSLIRDESALLYEKPDPRHGKCEYDGFAVSLKEDTAGNWWVYVQPYSATVFAIEDIDPAIEASPELEPDNEDPPHA